MKSIAFAVLALLLPCSSMPAFAEGDHGVGVVETDDLRLVYIDHVLSGSIGGRPVYAKPLTSEYGMTLQHRAGGQDFESTLRVVEGQIKAEVESIGAHGEAVRTTFLVKRVSAAEGLIIGTLGEQPFTVTVSSDEMDGHHYVNPHFDISVGAKNYQFTLDGGAACMGCATKLAYAIVSMLHLSGVL